MKKSYEEPELLVRNYQLAPNDVVMTSDPSNKDDLFDDDEYDIFA